MTYAEILAQLPPQIARSLQIKLEDAAVSTHLTEDEAREIVDGVVHQLRLEAQLSNDEIARDLDYLFSKITDGVIGLIFA
jgi:predicted HAD superfamily phosphohydrolase